MQPSPKNDPRQSSWEPVSWLTLDDGTIVMVERAISYTSEGHRFTVQSAHGSGFVSRPDFLNTLYRTFCDIVEPRT